MIKKMRHIGINVKDIDSAVKKFEAYGLPCTEVIEREALGMRIAFFSVGDTLIEFVSFVDPDKGWDEFHRVVRKYEGVINHICFEVDDLDASIKDFEKAGAKQVEGSPRPGAHGRVALFYPESTEGILIELCQV